MCKVFFMYRLYFVVRKSSTLRPIIDLVVIEKLSDLFSVLISLIRGNTIVTKKLRKKYQKQTITQINADFIIRANPYNPRYPRAFLMKNAKTTSPVFTLSRSTLYQDTLYALQ
jgi:hypothetical protein